MSAVDVRKRILVADDSEMVQVLARGTLEQAGYEIVCVGDGQAAVDACIERLPDLVLLDVMMPVMDGFAACIAIRGLARGAHLPILMMTGLDDVAAIHRAFEAGATDFISKPMRWPILAYRAQYMLRAAQAISELATSQSRLVSAQEAARLGHWTWRTDSDDVVLSDMTCRLLEVAWPDGRGTFETMLDGLHPDDRERVRTVLRSEAAQSLPSRVDCRVAPGGSGARHVLIQCGPDEAGDGVAAARSGTLQDITDLKRSEQKTRYLAFHDPLTGLPNRRHFNERLTRALSRAERHHGHCVVLALDLDKFKRINETLSHAVGDQLLKRIADRLAESIRAQDSLARRPSVDPVSGSRPAGAMSLARMGGDEFTILVSDLDTAESAAKIALRVLEVLRRPLAIAGQDVVISASIGIAVYPTDGDDLGNLLANADSAMYVAKNEGGNCFKFYNKPMNASALERLSLETNLRHALERAEFVLHYQPKLDLATGRVTGVEALIRWQHPGAGLVQPLSFVPLAEETGLIVPIGEWAIFEACRQGMAWQAQGHAPISVAVNLSARQFRQENLAATITSALDASGFAPHLLELEITESSIMQDLDAATATMRRLRALGCRISLDDFGTGYSSLAYLKRFPIDALKIDRSFVCDLPNDVTGAAIVRAILGMTRGMNIRVIAEGVEIEAQFDFLRDHDCDEAQGYLISRPVPASAIGPLLARNFIDDDDSAGRSVVPHGMPEALSG